MAPALPSRRLVAEGLVGQSHTSVATTWVSGWAGQQTLDEAVAAIKAAKAVKDGEEGRRTALAAALAAEGLSEYLPAPWAWAYPGADYGRECAQTG